MSKLHSKCQEKHFREKRTFPSGENFLKVKNYIVNFSERWAKFFWFWLKAFFFFTTARNFRQGWQLCTPHVEMFFWWNIFFRTNCNFSQRFWTPSEEFVEFWRKCLTSVQETAFHVCRGTCGEKSNYWKKMLIFCTLSPNFFFHVWHTFSSGWQNSVIRAYTNTLGKKLRSLIWENFFDVGENYWSGLTNLHSACPGNHFEITFLKSFKVALVFANRSGKFEAF